MELNTVEETQRIALGLLKEMTRFCDANDLRYFATAGTLLGAVREHGFISWDDDVDICMPRPDFERLRELYPSEYPYALKSNENTSGLHYSHMRLVDMRTRYEDRTTVDCGTPGVFIDVFPLDGMPSSPLARRFSQLKALALKKLYINAFCSLRPETIRQKNIVKAAFFKVMQLYGAHADEQRAYARIKRFLMKRSYEGSAYVGFWWGNHSPREDMPKEVFADTVELDFEDMKLMAPCGYDRWLTRIYGDYMTPIKEATAQHGVSSWRG